MTKTLPAHELRRLKDQENELKQLEDELKEDEREVLAADKRRWRRMGSGAQLNEWLDFGPGLRIRRQLAMRYSNSNAPEGRRYAEAFKALMKLDGLDNADPTVRHAMSAVLWFYDDREDREGKRLATLKQIRDEMTPGQRARLNSPITARQRVEKEQVREYEPVEPSEKKLTAAEMLKEKDTIISQLENDNDQLKKQNARLQQDADAYYAGSQLEWTSEPEAILADAKRRIEAGTLRVDQVLSLADAIIAEYRPKLMDAGKHVGERVITSDAPVKPMSLYQLRNINPGLAEQVDRGELTLAQAVEQIPMRQAG